MALGGRTRRLADPVPSVVSWLGCQRLATVTAQITALAAQHLVVAAHAQEMFPAGTAVGKLRPLQLAGIQAVGDPRLKGKHLPHHGLPGFAVGRDPAVTGKDQQMGQIMGDHLMQEEFRMVGL